MCNWPELFLRPLDLGLDACQEVVEGAARLRYKRIARFDGGHTIRTEVTEIIA